MGNRLEICNLAGDVQEALIAFIRRTNDDEIGCFATYENVFLNIDRYRADHSLAIDLISFTDGPIARLTVCLSDPMISENEAYVDTNNCPWALHLIEKENLGKLTGKTKRSGFCVYPLTRFNMSELKKYEYEGAY